LQSARWLVPDGAGVVIASRWLRGHIGKRITGHDVFIAVSAVLNERRPFSVAFVGSTEASLKAITRRYRTEFPNAQTLTTLSPPFRPTLTEEDAAEIARFIAATSPDLLWIGLTAPKQELLLAQLATHANFGFAAGIGAVFDFYIGKVKRSPVMFQRLGLEWLPRLLQQPRRLWRRTFVSAPIFLRDVAAQALRERLGRPAPRR
jgi:N-acetylglucosaminyldiphosphoundecaprenol N-acetyl-beta-D-mannosaminyltransferase